MAKVINDNEVIPSANLFWVVGIGASAGGLDAFKQLIKSIPVNSGMAYILVQHLDPNHESILVELLQKSTVIPIHEITDNVKVEPDHIYVIPSNKLLTANDGILNLTARPKTQNMSIDLFFTSLAEVHQSQAIGVVLSGTGHDGTLGLKAIKEQGGIAFVQQPQTAGYPEMPQSAINANVVDFVLPANEIVTKLLELKTVVKKNTDANTTGDNSFRQILNILDLKKGVDFTYYKQTTIRRRIARRMALRNLEKPEDYIIYLNANSSEVDILYQDILISVTEFFRDPVIFEQLCETALPVLVKNKVEGEPLRVWVVGCSTGQEVYTIGMCITEFLGQHDQKLKFQIFATDISEVAISKARSGIYTSHEVAMISPARLTRFFTKTEGGVQINKSIRDLCVFANHNILTAPPFANMDIISCRNVLIYMDTFLQRKAMSTFHYALKEKGMLLLGKSESVGSSSDLFASFNEHDKFYTRRTVPGRFIHVAAELRKNIRSIENDKASKDHRLADDFQRNADEVVLSKSAGGVIVNDQLEIVQFRGATGDWLESVTGKPSLNVLKMAKPDLVLELRSVLNKAKSTKASFIKEGIQLTGKNSKVMVSIEVIPLLNTINPYFLILFKNTAEITETKRAKKAGSGKLADRSEGIRVVQLEKDIFQMREDMRTITQDQDAGNQELLSANEELVSGSEELRSLNEELEISKEELQSTVEELLASNQEMTVRSEELNHARLYAEAIVTTIREPLIVLDESLRVKSANSSYYKTFRKSEVETVGKLFYELENDQWDIPELRSLLERSLLKNAFYESYEVKQKFTSIGERVMILNARKIFNEGSKEHLILLAIEDITERRILEDKLKKSADYVKAVMESCPQISSTSLANGRVNYFNQFFLEYSGLSFAEAIQNGWKAVIHPDSWEEEQMEWAQCVNTGKDFYKELLFRRHDGEYRWHISRALAIRNEDGVITSWVGTANDIHVQKMFSEELEKNVKERTQSLKESNIELEHSNKNLEQFAFIASHDLQEPLRKIKTFSNMLNTKFSKDLPVEGKKIIDRIFSSSERMSILIQDVLNFSRIESSQNAFITTDINHILNNVLVDFNLLISEKNAIVRKSELPKIEVIPLQINQLFYNLISNSLKFSRTDVQPVISITYKQLTDKEVARYPSLHPHLAYCEILFEDNGIGFEEEYAEKIFLIFQRLHTGSEFPGTGIGLALCKKIVINHHGEMFAEAVSNKGATFHIILPYTQEKADSIQLPE